MSKSYKLEDGIYIDDKSIIHSDGGKHTDLNTTLEQLKTDVENKHTYSTEEQVIGTWIDGKPIYRKVIVISQLSSDGLYNHNISNLDNLISITGSMYNPSGTGYGWQPIPRINISDMAVYGIEIGNFRDTTFKLTRGSGYQSFGKAIIILEYTKTTD